MYIEREKERKNKMFTLNYNKGTKCNGRMVFDNKNDAINTAWGMYVERFADAVVVTDKKGAVVYCKS